MMDFPMDILKSIAEDIVLFGGAAMALFYGLKRMYTTARNVEKLVEKSDKIAELNDQHRAQIKKDLDAHTQLESERHSSRDAKLSILSDSVSALTGELKAHVKMEEERDMIRDVQLAKITDNMNEIVVEMRPNGGSSMKDILNSTNKKVGEVHTRVAVLEQWKNDKGGTPRRKAVAKRAKKK
jgi:hypothetical protein